MKVLFRRVDARVAISTVAACVPVVIAMVLALTNRWTAMGDNAQVLLRARDVFTRHTPLVGARSSSGLALDFEFNNPGPILYYLFAIPARVLGDAGLVVTVAAMALVCIIAVAYVLNRAAGPVVAVLGLVAVAGLGWTMGRPLLIEPWQPHSLLHPFLLFLVLAWATAAGDQRLLPWTAGIATLLLQSHLTYVYVVPAVAFASVVALLVGAVRDRRFDPDRWARRAASLRRSVIAAATVLAVLWSPTMIEQVTARSRGNLSRLLEAGFSDVPTVGVELGLRRAAGVLVLWPMWLRPSFEHEEYGHESPHLISSLVGLVVVATVLGLAGWLAWRRRDRFALIGVVIAAAVTAAALYSATGTIDTVFGSASHHVLYLWPVAILVQLAVAVVLVRRVGPVGARRLGIAATVLVVALAAANLPDVERPIGPNESLDLGPVVREVNAELHQLEDRGTILVDLPSQPFAEPFSHPVFAELGRRGIDFVVRSPVNIRRFGETRAYEGEADAVVFLRWQSRALEEEPDAELVAFASLLDDEELDRWRQLRDELGGAVDRHGIELTDRGRDAASGGALDLRVERGEVLGGPGVVESKAFAEAIEADWVRLRGVPRAVLEEWIPLNEQLRRSALAIWLTDPATWEGT